MIQNSAIYVIYMTVKNSKEIDKKSIMYNKISRLCVFIHRNQILVKNDLTLECSN